MYSDIILKLDFHKKRIIEEFIKKGIYPTNSIIENRLSNIDANLALFKNFESYEGQNFNADEYNKAVSLITNDINILYETCYKLTVDKYNEQQRFINSHINELLEITNMYKAKAEFENSTTTLGKTLLFQNSGFLASSENSTTIYDLGEVEFLEASSVALFANISKGETSDVMFELSNNKEKIHCQPFNFSDQPLIMPGEKTIKIFETKLQDSQKVSSPILLDIPTNININNKYMIFGGKNMIEVKNLKSNENEMMKTPESLGEYVFKEKSYVNFYILNGGSISFNFNKKPLSANFSIEDMKVTNLNSIHHIFMEVEDGFSFSFEIDKGDIFGIKDTGIINNEKLFYAGAQQIRDFKIMEVADGKTVSYNVKLKIFNDNEDSVIIDSIVIKEVGGI